MPQTDPRELLVNIARVLNQMNIPYIVTRGIAVLVWGRPRFTADIDIIVGLKPEDVKSLKKALVALGKGGYIDEDAMGEAISGQGEFNFIDRETGVKVDFWVAREDERTFLQMERKIARNISGQKIYFISPEDLILSKLEWYKISQSSRHLEDAESVLKISEEKLDMNYLKKWAEKLRVLEKLNKLIKNGNN